MADFDFDIGIIGGGAAGLTVASGSAQLGARCLLVEKEDALGGDCLHFGCVPSKTLIRTAAVYNQMKNAGKYGLPRVDIPEVDFRDIAKRIQSVISTIQKHDSVERFCKLGARVEFGSPEFTDEHSIRLNGAIFTANKWVLATGSSPQVPELPGLEDTPYLTNRELFSLDRLPKSMVVIGAGPIAIEMAQAFSRLGTTVTVVQRSAQILSREDREMADTIMDALATEGVCFHLNSKVLRTTDAGPVKEVVISNPEGEKTLKAEAILVALGRKPNIEGLGLDRIGVEFDGRGIKTDARLRTAQKHIYAAGDVTGQYQFTHAAGYEGGVVISNAIFHLPKKADYTYLPWCTYTEPELASIGMNEKRAKDAGVLGGVWTEDFAGNDRSLAEGSSVGRIKMILDTSEKPVGVQIAGLHAGELVSEWVAALNGKVKLTTMASAVHPYPTLGEINKKVAGKLLATKLFSERVRKGLKFFFSLKGRACGEDEEQPV